MMTIVYRKTLFPAAILTLNSRYTQVLPVIVIKVDSGQTESGCSREARWLTGKSLNLNLVSLETSELTISCQNDCSEKYLLLSL